MYKEPGRNDPCWCGSQRKYKKCHLNRASEKDLPFQALAHEMKTEWDQKTCLHPQAAAGVCDRIVSAHTIQRSRVLQQIADPSNHVRHFHPFKPDFSRTVLEIEQVGWREASTFTGFCGRHDNLTFKPLEDVDFVGSPEQCFLIGYRALCHEVYQKLGLVKSYPRTRDLIDRGLSAEHQRELQVIFAATHRNERKGLEDFQKLKRSMDKQLIERDYSSWKRALISFRGDLSVASCGAVSPNRDMDGNGLQVLHDLDADIQQLLFGIVSTADGGAAVFTWQACDQMPDRFVQSLLAREKERLPSLLVQFAFAYIENTYFSNDWWSSLSKSNCEQIENLAAIGDAYYTNFSYSPSLTFVPWEITDVVVT